MIIPDLNLLIYTYDQKSTFHRQAKAWWEGCLSGNEIVGLAWVVVLGFLRIRCSPRIFVAPLPVAEAAEAVEAWLDRPQVQIVHPGARHAELVLGYLREFGIAGNLTTDTHLAALAVEYQATLHTSDTDFMRYSGLRWKNPLEKRG
jgi:uncharacterized protein